MALANAERVATRDVEAFLTYTVPTGEKPVSATFGPGGRLRERKGMFAEHKMLVHDARALNHGFSLDREGFRLAPHDTAVRDFYDEDELRAVYYPEMERLVKAETGAARVLVFDHTLRSGDEATQEARMLREPVRTVHNDYTDWSGPQRVRDLLPAEEAERLLRHRVLVIQVWRPVQEVVLSDPLAICDAMSVAPGDLIPTERRHPDRVGEIYSLAHNPDHRWYWYPEMRRNEALVFKCYDSMTDGRARYTAHGSFVDPTAPAGAPPRESIEIRTLAFFAPQ